MNWLSLLSEPERRAIVAELARLLAQESPLASAFESAVEKVLKGHTVPCLHCKGPIPFQQGQCPSCSYIEFKDPVLTTAHGPILDLINQCRDIAAFFRHDNPSARPTHQEGGRAFDRLLASAAAAEAALPKVKL